MLGAIIGDIVGSVYEWHNINFTRIILFAYKEYNSMDKEDKIRACYMHACLKRVNREFMTNSSLRERFGIDG